MTSEPRRRIAERLKAIRARKQEIDTRNMGSGAVIRETSPGAGAPAIDALGSTTDLSAGTGFGPGRARTEASAIRAAALSGGEPLSSLVAPRTEASEIRAAALSGGEPLSSLVAPRTEASEIRAAALSGGEPLSSLAAPRTAASEIRAAALSGGEPLSSLAAPRTAARAAPGVSADASAGLGVGGAGIAMLPFPFEDLRQDIEACAAAQRQIRKDAEYAAAQRTIREDADREDAEYAAAQRTIREDADYAAAQRAQRAQRTVMGEGASDSSLVKAVMKQPLHTLQGYSLGDVCDATSRRRQQEREPGPTENDLRSVICAQVLKALRGAGSSINHNKKSMLVVGLVVVSAAIIFAPLASLVPVQQAIAGSIASAGATASTSLGVMADFLMTKAGVLGFTEPMEQAYAAGVGTGAVGVVGVQVLSKVLSYCVGKMSGSDTNPKVFATELIQSAQYAYGRSMSEISPADGAIPSSDRDDSPDKGIGLEYSGGLASAAAREITGKGIGLEYSGGLARAEARGKPTGPRKPSTFGSRGKPTGPRKPSTFGEKWRSSSTADDGSPGMRSGRR